MMGKKVGAGGVFLLYNGIVHYDKAGRVFLFPKSSIQFSQVYTIDLYNLSSVCIVQINFRWTFEIFFGDVFTQWHAVDIYF